MVAVRLTKRQQKIGIAASQYDSLSLSLSAAELLYSFTIKV